MTMLGMDKRNVKPDDPKTWPNFLLMYVALPENDLRFVPERAAYNRYVMLCRHLEQLPVTRLTHQRKLKKMVARGWVEVKSDLFAAISATRKSTEKQYARREFDFQGRPVWPWWHSVTDSDSISENAKSS